MVWVFAAGVLVLAGACGHTDQKSDQAKSAAAHSVDTVESASAQSVVISGKAEDCLVPGKEYGVQMLEIRAFNPTSNSTLVGVLRSLDTLDFMGPPATRARWNSAGDQLERLWINATALTHDSTSSTGAFSLTAPASDSVLVLTFDHRDDVPLYYQYKMVGGRSNLSLLLDMSGGRCGP